MPKPKGWTEKHVKMRDSCVAELMNRGVPKGRNAEERSHSPRQRAYAICSAVVEKRRRGGK